METATAEEAEVVVLAVAEATGGPGNKKMKVLVAVDESEGSLYALSWALDNLFTCSVGGGVPVTSEQLGRLILLHAQPPLHHFMHPVGPAVHSTSSVTESVKKAQEENCRNVLNRALQVCRQRLVSADTVIVVGDPKDVICEAVEQMQVDLLVVGSRGLGKIKRAVLGSVSDYCAHHAKPPVLIVKPPK